jgi:hypothetical protein
MKNKRLHCLVQSFSTFVRPRPGNFFYKTRAGYWAADRRLRNIGLVKRVLSWYVEGTEGWRDFRFHRLVQKFSHLSVWAAQEIKYMKNHSMKRKKVAKLKRINHGAN